MYRTPAEMKRDPCPFDKPLRREQPERTKRNDVARNGAGIARIFARSALLGCGRHCLAPKNHALHWCPASAGSRFTLINLHGQIDRPSLTPPAALDDDLLQMRWRLRAQHMTSFRTTRGIWYRLPCTRRHMNNRQDRIHAPGKPRNFGAVQARNESLMRSLCRIRPFPHFVSPV